MADKYYDYGALATGFTFANGDTGNAALIGATTTNITNGTLGIVADAPAGLTNSLEGLSQGTSGTSYVSETITGTTTFSGSIYWKMPALGTIGSNVFFAGNGGTRVFAVSILSTEQVRFLDAAGGNAFTTTYAGGFVPGQWYRTDFHGTVATATTGRLVGATYTEHGTTPLTNTSFDTGTTVNLGTLAITTIRHGTRSGTGTADDGIHVRFGYDPTSARLMGPQSITTTLVAPSLRFGLRTAPGTVTSEVVFVSNPLIMAQRLSPGVVASGVSLAAPTPPIVAMLLRAGAVMLDKSDTANLTGSGTLTISGTAAIPGAVNLTGSGTDAPVGSAPALTAALARTGNGVLSIVGFIPSAPAASVTLSGSGTLVLGGSTPAIPGAAGLSGSGTLSISGSKSVSSTLNLSGSGTLAATGVPAISGSRGFTGSGSLDLAVSDLALTAMLPLSQEGSVQYDARINVFADWANLGASTLAILGSPGGVGGGIPDSNIPRSATIVGMREGRLEVIQGDQITLVVKCSEEMGGYTHAEFYMSNSKHSVSVMAYAPFTGKQVVFQIGADDFDEPGDYWGVVRMFPGPHSYPSDRALLISVQRKLVTV